MHIWLQMNESTSSNSCQRQLSCSAKDGFQWSRDSRSRCIGYPSDLYSLAFPWLDLLVSSRVTQPNRVTYTSLPCTQTKPTPENNRSTILLSLVRSWLNWCAQLVDSEVFSLPYYETADLPAETAAHSAVLPGQVCTTKGDTLYTLEGVNIGLIYTEINRYWPPSW